MQKHIKILDIFFGNKCNLACSNCDTRSDHLRTDENDPDIENIKQSIVLANQKFDIENWSLLGGEPFLYKDRIIEILEFLRTVEPNKTIFLATNGLLLEQNIEYAVNLIKKYKVWLQVCNHTVGFKNQKITEKIIRSVDTIGKACELPKIEPAWRWWDDILKFNSGTIAWQEYLKRKQLDIAGRDPNDITYLENNYGIHYMESPVFQTISKFNGINYKPFNSESPDLSYRNSCPSQFCAFLINKKIYKCAALGTLRNFLEKHNQLDDTDWKPYLNYKPVDLENCNDDQINHFVNTHYTHVSECSMCPSNCTEVIKNEMTVLPKNKNEYYQLHLQP